MVLCSNYVALLLMAEEGCETLDDAQLTFRRAARLCERSLAEINPHYLQDHSKILWKGAALAYPKMLASWWDSQ